MIIPDAVLGIISFEALIDANKLAGKKIAKDNFAELPYLLKKYNIAYTYSSMLLLKPQVPHEKHKYDYLAFAPIFKNANNYAPTSAQRAILFDESNLATSDKKDTKSDLRKTTLRPCPLQNRK
jgi:hypothetical protein